MHKVIFDTDPGVDDAMALLFLVRHPEIDLVGITTTFGNASIETTTRNALYLKQQWEIDAPVSKGSGDKYAAGEEIHPFPNHIHGDDGLGNIGVPDVVDVPLDPRTAQQFIIETVKAHPGEITLVAVGRMTNLANALKEAPEIAGLVKEVVIMGGAFDVPGNVTPAAEANIHGDAAAADAVMTAPWKVVVVGLDVTLKTAMSRATLAALAAKGGAAMQLLDRVSQFYIDFYDDEVTDSMVVHDTCACVYVVARELFTTRSGSIRVMTDSVGEGKTLQKPDGMRFGPSVWDGLPSQLACVDVDAENVMKLVEETLIRH
ncbi:nucleoside hydrolase [Rhizobium sp. KVB221]|uniref:Nucleoside hydrolase n=1 Tax=Rhizobium setariae TaxID=2801340 RepID=A0A937CPF9_9HYPH|nr:nucleoside hydrolase [Rhizobium setariae]MBL0373149.1 nucleoside hydrolase [Rhizobium setariae]